MRVFAQSVNDKSMAPMHDHIAHVWRRQVSVELLDDAFGGFYDLGVDLMILERFSPQFSKQPAFDEYGALAIEGTYPTEPSTVTFKHQYVYEGLGWKLTGFNVNIG